MATPIFRWNGEYVGFLHDNAFFDANGRYLGWINGAKAWNIDGTLLGYLVDRHYILRNLTLAPPVRQTPRVPPVLPMLPLHSGNRIAKTPKPGWEDALATLGLMPNNRDMIGEWRSNDERVHFEEDGVFSWLQDDKPALTGTWSLNGNILKNSWGVANIPQEVEYLIIEFKRDSLLLRQLAQEQRSIPFTLVRIS